jgi:rubrerythrin
MPVPVVPTALPYPIVDPLAEAAIQQLEGAVTIASPVILSNGAIDDLQGQLISQLHHPDDALLTRLYTLARLLRGTEQYNTYPMRILQGPQKRPFWVQKQVHLVTLNGQTTWVTTNTALDQQGTYVMPSVEDIEGLLRDYVLQIVAPSHIASQLFADLVTNPTVMSLGTQKATLPTALKTSNSIIEAMDSNSREISQRETRSRLIRIEATMARYQKAGKTELWVRRGATAVKIGLEELRMCYKQAIEQRKLCCMRCLHVWEPLIPNPLICPHCQQDWSEFYTRRPYGSRQGHA